MDKPEKKFFTHPQTLHAWVDGSARPDGSASCAYVIFSERTKHIVKMSRFAMRGSTNNQAELMAVNKALDHPNSDYIILYSDSTYVISCLTAWRHNWAKNNWMTPLGDPVKNKELIQEIGEKIDRKKFVGFKKVKAHSGDPFNSVADHLAQGLSNRMTREPELPDGEYTV